MSTLMSSLKRRSEENEVECTIDKAGVVQMFLMYMVQGASIVIKR